MPGRVFFTLTGGGGVAFILDLGRVENPRQNVKYRRLAVASSCLVTLQCLCVGLFSN